MPIRDLLIVGILVVALPYAFRHVFVGVLLWAWIGIMNPHKLAYGFSHDAPLAAIVFAVTMIGLFSTRDRVKLDWPAPPVLLLIFILWMAITTVFAIFPGDSLDQLIKILKIQVMTFIAIAVLYKREHIRLFIWINVLSIGYYGAKGGLFTIRSGGGYRVWGPPGGFIEGNNELALAMVMVIPLMYFLRATSPHVWVRRGLLVMMLLTAISAIGTQSRGALLAIAAMGVLLWYRAPNKFMNAFGVLFVAVSIFAFMPQSWHERMGTIKTYQEDSSAMGRINAWETAINIANDRPFGAGFEMYSQTVFLIYAPNPVEQRVVDPRIARAAHSIYFQVLGEHGWIGLALFLMLWLATWRLAARVRRKARRGGEEEWVFHFASMAQVSMVGFAVGGAFLSLAYFDLPYNVLAAVVVTARWLREREALKEPDMIAAKPGRGTSAFRRLIWWMRTA